MEDIIMKLEELIAQARQVEIGIAHIEDDGPEMNEAFIKTREAIRALRTALQRVKEA